MTTKIVLVCAAALSTMSPTWVFASSQFNYQREAMAHIANGDWVKGYESIEVALGSDDPKTRLWGYDLLVANPAIKAAAKNSFSEDAVVKKFALSDPVTANDIERYRLSLYSRYASEEEVEIATANIQKAFNAANVPRLALIQARKASGSSLIVTSSVFEQLTVEDQKKLNTLYPNMLKIPSNSIGKIISSQILNKSSLGSSAGSQLGAAFGQAAYIDRTFSGGNYSAVSQIGAGLLGAVIGSSLNKSPQQRFLVSYGIQLSDGAVKSVTSDSPDGFASPVGQCVYVVTAQEAPAYLCADTLVIFLERAGKLASNVAENAPRPLKVSVKCKISTIATLTLAPEECQRLNGETVEK